MITSYEQMPVGAYCKIMAAIGDKEASDSEKHIALLSALTGLTADQILDEPLEDFAEQTDAAGFVLVYPEPHAIRDTYTLRGVAYHPTTERRKMTAGQFIDWNEIAGNGVEDKWAELLACILVPEGKTYGNGYDIAEVAEAIRAELCILDGIALRAFFLTLCAGCVTDTLPSLERAMRRTGSSRRERRRMRRESRRLAAVLAHAGAGWQTLTRWLKLPDAAGMLQPQ